MTRARSTRSKNYRKEIENFPVPYFQVMGNHDYDMKFTDDFEAAGEFRRIIGPTYYSFNLGDIHYVVLDNMYYLNKDGDRSHDTYVDDEQLAWLKKTSNTSTSRNPSSSACTARPMPSPASRTTRST